MLMLSGFVAAAGCETAGQGAVSGGAVGALSGLAIGSLTGSAGKGAAIGAIGGAIGGAVIGDQNRRANEAAASTSTPPPYTTGGPLWQLVGDWKVTGDEVTVDGQRLVVTGTARGNVDKNYFLRLDITINDPRSSEKIEGTSVIAQEGGDRISMSNSFSSSPQMIRYEGRVQDDGKVFIVKQSSPLPVNPRKITIRIADPSRWATEVKERRNGQDITVESFTFTRS